MDLTLNLQDLCRTYWPPNLAFSFLISRVQLEKEAPLGQSVRLDSLDDRAVLVLLGQREKKASL